MRHGMAFLTEDRKETGCFLILDVLENMQIAVLSQAYVKGGFVAEGEVGRVCEEISPPCGSRRPTCTSAIINLSGGNQQKVLIGRWLLTKPKILILDEPTRGIDVGAKAEIHRLITKLAGEGVAVMMISSELPEVLGMSDRIMVMHEGHVSGFLDRAEADQVKIMELAALSSGRLPGRKRHGNATEPPRRCSQHRRSDAAAGRPRSASSWCCSASR